MVARIAAVFLLAASASACRQHDPRSFVDRPDTELELAKLRARYPEINAHVLGGDAEFERVRLARQASKTRPRRRAATQPGYVATPTVPLTGAPGPLASATAGTVINSPGLAQIAVNTLPEVQEAFATPTPGAIAFSGAPALPAATIVPSQWPTLDVPPPLDSTFVKSLLAKVDLSAVPNIPLTGLNGCTNTTYNAQAIANAAQNGWWTCGQYTRATDVTSCPNTMDFGLSLDDGPSPDTPRLLNTFAQENPPLKATFFIVGSRAISRPAMVQAEHIGGHQMCAHTWSHTALTQQTNEEIVAELGWSAYAIQYITGVSPNCMRPPYGDIDDRVRAVIKAMGLTPYIWTDEIVNGQRVDFDSNDWDLRGGVRTVSAVISTFQPILDLAPSLPHGFIALDHDLDQQSVSLVLDYVLPYSLQKGFKMMPIIQCLGKTMADSYVETASNASAATAVQTVAGSSVPHASGTAMAATSLPSSSIKGAGTLARSIDLASAAVGLLALSLIALS